MKEEPPRPEAPPPAPKEEGDPVGADEAAPTATGAAAASAGGPSAKKDEEQALCVICIEPLEDPVAMQQPCTHVVACYPCMVRLCTHDGATGKKTTCPICRAVVKSFVKASGSFLTPAPALSHSARRAE